jgi:hypothetical protein
MTTLVPKLRARRRMFESSAVYQTTAVPHLLDPIKHAVILPRGAPQILVRKRTKAVLAAARKEEQGRR